MIDELDNSRPIIYAGYTSSGPGHVWVIDGYYEDTPSSYKFHCNFGWNGTSDGYWFFNEMAGYTENQEAI